MPSILLIDSDAGRTRRLQHALSATTCRLLLADSVESVLGVRQGMDLLIVGEPIIAASGKAPDEWLSQHFPGTPFIVLADRPDLLGGRGGPVHSLSNVRPAIELAMVIHEALEAEAVSESV